MFDYSYYYYYYSKRANGDYDTFCRVMCSVSTVARIVIIVIRVSNCLKTVYLHDSSVYTFENCDLICNERRAARTRTEILTIELRVYMVECAWRLHGSDNNGIISVS